MAPTSILSPQRIFVVGFTAGYLVTCLPGCKPWRVPPAAPTEESATSELITDTVGQDSLINEPSGYLFVMLTDPPQPGRLEDALKKYRLKNVGRASRTQLKYRFSYYAPGVPREAVLKAVQGAPGVVRVLVR